MNFVKSGVYLAEFTEKGIKEQEISTRDPKEREEEERLRKLPEFQKDPNFKSLAEQLEANELQAETDRVSGEPAYSYIPAAVTEEEAEFLDQLERKRAKRVREEENELKLFRESQARATHQFSLVPPSDNSTATIHDDNRRDAPKTAGSLGRQDGPRVLISVKGKRTPEQCTTPEGEGSKPRPSKCLKLDTSKCLKLDNDQNSSSSKEKTGLIEGYDDDEEAD